MPIRKILKRASKVGKRLKKSASKVRKRVFRSGLKPKSGAYATYRDKKGKLVYKKMQILPDPSDKSLFGRYAKGKEKLYLAKRKFRKKVSDKAEKARIFAAHNKAQLAILGLAGGVGGLIAYAHKPSSKKRAYKKKAYAQKIKKRKKKK